MSIRQRNKGDRRLPHGGQQGFAGQGYDARLAIFVEPVVAVSPCPDGSAVDQLSQLHLMGFMPTDLDELTHRGRHHGQQRPRQHD